MYRRQDADTSCLALPDDENGVRDVLHGLLRSTRPLQHLGLTDLEWESLLSQQNVSWLVDPVLRARYAVVSVWQAVELHVCYDAVQMLMMTCKDSGAVGGDTEAECSVCLVALRESEAMELPACAHTFHRRCISEWKPISFYIFQQALIHFVGFYCAIGCQMGRYKKGKEGSESIKSSTTAI
ncbi:RING-H2 finger protein ATL3C [Zea mays]|uniref:RING-H2 finger protein ATL3C n=1 Tax=Zea mays TaxID=4577 RepID=A0A1D6N1Y6_MAIZE|nr:RING-H2 finger protein ATL3C [Zea mays]